MVLTKFLYPIVDSGYFFDFELLEMIKVDSAETFSLKFKYRLTNNYSIRLQIPIMIAHIAHLDCTTGNDFDRDETPKIYGEHVADLQDGRDMYGYSDDHYVVFEPGAQREFLVFFGPSETDFDTVDLEFFMKPGDDEYGKYRLRYDFKSGRMINRFCLRKYDVKMRPFSNPGS